MNEFYLQILDKKGLKVFKILSNFNEDGFLAGGTALALQLGHRRSYDFDFFCYKPISSIFVNKIRKNFFIKKIATNTSDEFTFFDKTGIKVTFVYYPFKFKSKLVNIESGPKILSVLDIISAKAYALNRRGNWRDYLDLYFILKNRKVSLGKIIQNAQDVFNEMFSKKLFLSQLIYHEDLDKNDIKSVNFFRNKANSQEMKEFFEKEIKNYNKN